MSVSGNTITIALDKTNNATITKDDISNLNAVSVNELTEFDMLVLQSRITNNAAINSLISALSGNTTSSISNVNI